MEKPIFFLSHSEKDKEFVKQLALKLGRGKCWMYEWEVKPGESIFKFDKGIADSRVFVLIWSKDASQSPWVTEETTQARMRLARDKGFRLIVTILDDTPLPDSLAYRAYIDGRKGLEYVHQALKSVAQDLTPQELFVGKPVLKDSFQDREREIDMLEQMTFSSHHSGIIVLGLDGMGKTSLIKRAISLLFSQLTPLWVDLATSSTPLRLLSAFARPLGIAVDPEELSVNYEHVWLNRILPEIAESENTFVVIDNLAIAGIIPALRSTALDKLVERVLADLGSLDKPDNPNVIVVSSRTPDFGESTLARYHQLQLGPLDNKSIVRSLRFLLSQQNYADYNTKKLEELAEELRGYPLALNLAVARVMQSGLDAVLADKPAIQKMLLDLVDDFLANLQFDNQEKQLLILLATAMRPMTLQWLRAISGKDLSAIDRVAKKQLLDQTSPAYSLHNIVSAFVLESLAKPAEIKAAHGKLADLFKTEWASSLEKSAASAEYGALAWFHSLSAGRASEAQNLSIAYLEEGKQAAVESYRRGEWKTTIKYVEMMKKMGGGMDANLHFYYALALGRANRFKDSVPIMQNLVNQFPDRSHYHHAFGTIFRWMRDNQAALKEFRQAVATSTRPDATILASMADLLCDIGEFEEAKTFAKQAFDINPSKSHVVSIMSRVLGELKDLDGALDIVMKALKRAPTDARLHARAGIILKRLGKLPDAKRHLREAISDPNLTHAYTALADVYLMTEEYTEAERVLRQFPGRRKSDASYLSTEANIMRHKGELAKAEEYLQRAISLEPDNLVHHGGMANLKLDQASEYASKGERQRVLICIDEAKLSLDKALSYDAYNEILLTIKHRIEQFESSLGLQ